VLKKKSFWILLIIILLAILGNFLRSLNLKPATNKVNSVTGEVTILTAVQEQDGKISVKGKTNLPSGTEIHIDLDRWTEPKYHSQDSAIVDREGNFYSRTFSFNDGPLMPNDYALDISVYCNKFNQTAEILEILGDGCSNLSGPLLKKDTSGISDGYYIDREEVVTVGKGSVAGANKIDANLREYISIYCRLYDEFQTFKHSPSFQTWGYSQGGPYAVWYNELQELGKHPMAKNVYRMGFHIHASELIVLGSHYYRGDSNDPWVMETEAKLEKEVQKAKKCLK
jgi:hypothetical protein